MSYIDRLLPRISDAINSTMKMIKSTLAILASVDAIPRNPKIAATIAKKKNINVHPNIRITFLSWLSKLDM